ncbi:MAG: hypothetical protein OXC99_03320 [Chloroflexi bacterium]|nr:hypothetical protein [Chloroflexota bacterium]
MSGHSAPKGLHRRTKALELRLAEMEASMAALQSEYAAASAPSHDTLDVSRLAERLAATQKAYDDVLLDLRELQSMAPDCGTGDCRLRTRHHGQACAGHSPYPWRAGRIAQFAAVSRCCT